MSIRYALTLAVAALCAALAAVPTAIEVYRRYAHVDAERMLAATVSIETISHVRIDKVGDSVWEQGSGSGFLVSANDCEVWTNRHVIADAAVIEVVPRHWPDARGIPARVVNSSPRADVAILRMDHCEGLAQARFGDSSRVAVGDDVYAVGNPLGRNRDSVSRGIISHTERYQGGAIPFLQTDAAVNPGNSGGALFNRDGEVIGINTGIAATETGTNVGVGYAIPIAVARDVIARLRKGPPRWGDAGLDGIVSSLSPAAAAVFGVPDGRGAIVVTETPAEGPGSGSIEAHDVIYRIGDIDVTDAKQALRVVGAHDPGEAVDFAIVRAGEPMKVAITLADGWSQTEAPEADYFDGYLGMTVEMWDAFDDERGQFHKPVITKVHSLGPAHRAHISSSQRAMTFRGPYLVPYLLDVKQIVGVVFDGRSHPVDDVDDVEQWTVQAAALGRPLLLEIEYWVRENPIDAGSPLRKAGVSFHRIEPALTTARAPGRGSGPEDGTARAQAAAYRAARDPGLLPVLVP